MRNWKFCKSYTLGCSIIGFVLLIFATTAAVQESEAQRQFSYAKKLMDRYSSFGPSDFTNPHRAYIRKAQYQFGWDFCPQLPGCGIWRPVKICGIKKA